MSERDIQDPAPAREVQGTRAAEAEMRGSWRVRRKMDLNNSSQSPYLKLA